MTVSVIVLTCNRAHMVREAIDSILSQTNKDFELIVVDNYSSDETEQVIKAYTDERIRYFRHRNNGLIAVNRNYGIDKARGEYVAFCDDDDLWMPEKLEKQLLGFEGDSQIGLVCTNAIDFDRGGEHGKRIKAKLKDSDFTFESLIWGDRIICSSVLVRKEVINDVGMMDESPEISMAPDYELWLRVARKYKVKYIDLPLVKYRAHSGACGKKDIEALEQDKMVHKRLLDKGIIAPELYRKRINKLDRRIAVVKLLTYIRVTKYILPLARLLYNQRWGKWMCG
ncbi:MAG TPA: glycosyltransferase [Dehalococcoidia bacterium]|nr:glycosyltransferase [Dehalococcoidia bacterium]